MRRAHALSSSQDIIFADSTASCDLNSYVITMLLTPCAAGAVPLGIVITGGQSTIEYTTALQLLKNGLGDSSFNGQQYPTIVMTDNSDAERLAFRTVWPESDLLLCRFHICQAVWRWLSKNENNIPTNQRPILYQDFNKILVSLTTSEAQENYNVAKESGKFHKTWLSYMESYWTRRETWCLAYRNEKLRGHHTNNFAEINIRLFKEETLNRFKAYNVVTLVDKICGEMQAYYISKLKNFANSRNDCARLNFEKEKKKAAYLTEDRIKHIGDLFLVPSEKDEKNIYTVDPGSGFCSCSRGKFGMFCKHAAAIHTYFNENAFFKNLPPVTTENRYEMAVLAFGTEVGPIAQYQPLQIQSERLQTTEHQNIIPEFADKPPPQTQHSVHQEQNSSIEWLRAGLKILAQKIEEHGDKCSEKVRILVFSTVLTI